METDNEKKYMSWFDKFSPIFHHESINDDFTFTRQFDKIVLSNSTLHYWMAFLSHANTIYMPENYGEFGIKNVKNHGEHCQINDCRGIGIRKKVKFTDYSNI